MTALMGLPVLLLVVLVQRQFTLRQQSDSAAVDLDKH